MCVGSPLVGAWERHMQLSGTLFENVGFEFFSDGHLVVTRKWLNAEKGSWAADGNRLSVIGTVFQGQFTFSVSENLLNLQPDINWWGENIWGDFIRKR